ncbi:flagellar protein FlaG [Aquimonas voraii]|uniref:Flagellar protein FlaG n=1 Tax=Aquimonas voraii TaxID=265719 RepID=A0A1G6YH11_9GAMM|nr:flagellar protein FlaG [Aquimonas voraii]SDD89658.1 flagellar protein FlaG [Aquimonas voraii]
MNTINPLSTLMSPAAALRSSGASALSAPVPVPSAAAVAASDSPQAQALQAPPGKGEAGDRPRGRDQAESLQRELDEVMKDVQTALRFRVDDDADQVVVSIVDRESGDVIQQIPSEVSLRIAKRMAELGSGMINESA